jgi:hypothetical protein
VVDDGDKARLMFWTLYFAAIATSIVVLAVIVATALAGAGAIADKLAIAVLGITAILLIIWFYVIRPATAEL